MRDGIEVVGRIGLRRARMDIMLVSFFWVKKPHSAFKNSFDFERWSYGFAGRFEVFDWAKMQKWFSLNRFLRKVSARYWMLL